MMQRLFLLPHHLLLLVGVRMLCNVVSWERKRILKFNRSLTLRLLSQQERFKE
jgi:hypothetical protein